LHAWHLNMRNWQMWGREAYHAPVSSKDTKGLPSRGAGWRKLQLVCETTTIALMDTVCMRQWPTSRWEVNATTGFVPSSGHLSLGWQKYMHTDDALTGSGPATEQPTCNQRQCSMDQDRSCPLHAPQRAISGQFAD
jgi:hypothetical protein